MSVHAIRRRKLGRMLLGMLPASVLAQAPVSAPRGDRTRVPVAIAGRAGMRFLPLLLADQLGYFRTEGVEVEWIELGEAARPSQLLGAGASVAAGSFEQVLQLASAGLDTRAFSLMARAPQVALAVSARSLGLYRTPAQLQGRRIGVPAVPGIGALVTELVLQRAGLRAADVRYWTYSSPAQAVAAIRSGQIDAVCAPDPLITQLELRGEIRPVVDTRNLRGTAELFGVPSIPSACLVASTDFLQRQPQQAQALANAVMHALKWLQTASLRDILGTVPEMYLLGDRALYLASFNRNREAISTDGLFPADGARQLALRMAEIDPALAAEPSDWARAFTNDFTRRARERYPT